MARILMVVKFEIEVSFFNWLKLVYGKKSVKVNFSLAHSQIQFFETPVESSLLWA